MKQMEPEQWEKRLAGSPLRPGEGGFSKDLMRKIKERVEVEGNPRSRRWLKLSPVLLACVLLAFAFTRQEELGGLLGQLSKPASPAVLSPMDQEKELTLKVAYFHENTFSMRYGKAYTIRYPNVEVKIVPVDTSGWGQADYKEKMVQLIDKENPDVLYLSPDLYSELAKEGRLYPLEAVMKQDHYDLQNLYSGVTDTLRRLGEGKLYGLAPEYEMNALYYNKSLFDKYGVPYPKDKMSWEEVLQLAARFPADGTGENRIYGLMPSYYSNASELAMQIGKTNGISLIGSDGTQATVNTDAWKKVWGMAIDGFQKGYVYKREPSPQRNMMMDEVYKRNPFISGKAAMAVYGFSLSNDLKQAASRYNMPSFPWDIVSEPVHPAHPDETSSLFIGSVFAINAKSEHLRPAWEMLKLINSLEIAKKLDKSYGGGLSVHLKALKPDEEHNYAPFYSMKPAELPDSSVHPRLLRKFNEAFAPAAAQRTGSVVEGKERLDDMLKQLQEDAQKALFNALIDSRN
ncbi:ABC transporter substrate-binding protein [Paenibacillus sp. 32352]|uniref:ABC transporter substrate-binding protein n=1 Tax=Paenibacillus sp. 32352 TaxID=1969111 RepID=UPI0009AD2782|nr:extracellular solute-binding protein [Paenibacillus sp. 32352]